MVINVISGEIGESTGVILDSAVRVSRGEMSPACAGRSRILRASIERTQQWGGGTRFMIRVSE